MGKLYDYGQRIQNEIDSRGLDVFKTRGEMAMRCGFIITLLRPDEPDDPAKLVKLKDAAKEVLGITLD